MVFLHLYIHLFALPVHCSKKGTLLTICIENRRFVETIIKGRKRFEALRDFTVEGALAEVDRMNMERKDAGESVGVSSPAVRHSSAEIARSQTAARSSSLSNVPENSAFSIGEDEDEDGDDSPTTDHNASTRPTSSSSNVAVEDALPTQSRSMSEKARGKQPMGQGNFSRSTSRTNSNISLPSLASAQSHSQTFAPNYQWVSNCLPVWQLSNRKPISKMLTNDATA